MHKHNAVIVAAACSTFAMALTPISSRAAAEDEDIIELIIVTAQKRATALQDVPFSVAATSEAQIRNSGAGNIVELSRNFAGLPSPISAPARARSRFAASAPARWFAISCGWRVM